MGLLSLGLGSEALTVFIFLYASSLRFFFARWTSSWNAACNLNYMKIASGKQQRKLITKLCKRSALLELLKEICVFDPIDYY